MENKILFAILGTILIFGIFFPSYNLDPLNESLATLEEKAGVFAYLVNPNTTTITTANTFYALEGIFNNSVIEHFYYDFGLNAIVYNNTKNRTMLVGWSGSLTANIPNTEVIVSINKSGIRQMCGSMKIYLVRAGEYVTASGVCVLNVKPEDYIQLIITSDGNGDQITFSSFSTYINNFFNEG